MKALPGPTRIATIEVGSRAVRLLIADVTGGRLDPVLTRSRETRLMGMLKEGTERLGDALSSVNGIIAEFEELAEQHMAGHVEVFGTEAARRLFASGRIEAGSGLSRARILTAEEEALCSAIAARSAHRDPAGLSGPFLVIDQGGGSVELVSGTYGSDVTVTHNISLDLGAEVLLERFALSGHDLTECRDQFEREIVLPFEPQDFVATFALGSVATKWGWLFSDPPRGSRYSSRRAHGVRIEVSKLKAMIEVFVRLPYADWDDWRATFDPANPTGDDMERVITGGVALVIILDRLCIDHFVVSAEGTRHGFALMKAGVSSRPV